MKFHLVFGQILNRAVSITNAKNQVTETSYDFNDLINQQKRISSGGDVITNYFYDSNDNLTEVENALGNSTFYDYDNGDKLISSTFGDDTKQFEYYKDGKLKKYTKPDGTIMNQLYDEEDKLKNDGYAAYTYDDLGNVKTVTSNDNAITMTYDDMNRLKTVTDYYGKTVTYDYDNNGNTTKITYPGNFIVNYEYDNANRLKFVKWDNNSKIVEYTYLKDNRLSRIDYPNGSYCTYTYDAAGRITGKSWKKSNEDIINEYSFTLDKLGNHLEENKTEPYGVPSLYSTLENVSYNVENEPTNASFDQNGNQTSGGGLSSSTWNKVDLPTSLDGDIYEYDGLKLRRKTVINGETKKYVWDIRGMGNILAEMDASNNITGYYIHGLGLVAKVINNQSYYYHDDFRGSVIAITNESENIVNKYNYDPFGYVTDQSETISNPFKYVGIYGVMADNVDRHYMRARYMDSKSGRFLSEDPVWNDNLYVYASNNPMALIDSDGLDNTVPAYETIPSFGGKKVFSFGFGSASLTSCIICIEPTIDKDPNVVKMTYGVKGSIGVGVSSEPKIVKGDFDAGVVDFNYMISANASFGVGKSFGATSSIIMTESGLPAGGGLNFGPFSLEGYLYIDIDGTNDNISNKYGRNWYKRLEYEIIKGFSNRAF